MRFNGKWKTENGKLKTMNGNNYAIFKFQKMKQLEHFPFSVFHFPLLNLCPQQIKI
jgi:hypothetical protein